MALSVEFQNWLKTTGIVPSGDPSGLPVEQQAPIYYMSFAFDQADVLITQKSALIDTSNQIDLTSAYLNNEQIRQEITQCPWPTDPATVTKLVGLLNTDSTSSIPAYVPGGPSAGPSADQIVTNDQLKSSIASAQAILDVLQGAQTAAANGTATSPLIQWPTDATLSKAVSDWFAHEGLTPTSLPPPPVGTLLKPPDNAPPADITAYNNQEQKSTDWSNLVAANQTAWAAHYNALTTQITSDNNAWQSQAQSQSLPIQYYITSFTTAVTNAGDLIAKRKDAVTTPVNNMAPS